jgi:hypothetical protein
MNNNQLIDAWIDAYQRQSFDVIGTLNFQAHTSRQQVKSTASNYWNIIDAHAFGKANVKRRHMRLARVCMLDGGPNITPHHPRRHRQPSTQQHHTTAQHVMPQQLPAHDASTNWANWHYHFSIKSAGAFGSSQQLVDFMQELWQRQPHAGSHSQFAILDPHHGHGWHAYMAHKSLHDMEDAQFTTIPCWQPCLTSSISPHQP